MRQGWWKDNLTVAAEQSGFHREALEQLHRLICYEIGPWWIMPFMLLSNKPLELVIAEEVAAMPNGERFTLCHMFGLTDNQPKSLEQIRQLRGGGRRVRGFGFGPVTTLIERLFQIYLELDKQKNPIPKGLSPIERIDWTVRTYNLLRKGRINNFGDLLLRTDKDLRKIRNFGPACLKEVETKLQEHSLSLRKS